MKVRYVGAVDEQVSWGGSDDPRPLLKEGEVYTVFTQEVHTWHTKTILTAYPTYKFPSVCFEEI